MSGKKPKATHRRMISCFAQIVQEHIPGWKIEQIASGEKVKTRKFSYCSQVYLLMLSQFLHLFSLNEIVDVSKIYALELSRLRGVTPASLNTFSNANRTRDPKVMQSFFWAVYDAFRRQDGGFIRGRHHGRLTKFNLRGSTSRRTRRPATRPRTISPARTTTRRTTTCSSAALRRIRVPRPTRARRSSSTSAWTARP